jgi:hypothetical protein
MRRRIKEGNGFAANELNQRIDTHNFLLNPANCTNIYTTTIPRRVP